MGYTTNFLGSFQFSRELTEQELSFLTAFCASRRIKRDPNVLLAKYNGAHGYPFIPTDPYGPEGDYCTLSPLSPTEEGITDYNEPPVGQPSLWCHWSPTATELAWNGAEKFYAYTEWLQYLLDHFFIPWGVQLNGAVQWEGEDPTDLGILSVRNNRIAVHYEETAEDSDQEN